MNAKITATVVGVLAGVVFFPVEIVAVCNGECHQSGQTWWGLTLTESWAGVAPLLAATLAGLITYRIARK